VLARQPGDNGAWSLASIITTANTTTAAAATAAVDVSSTGELNDSNSGSSEYAVLFADGTEAEGLSFVHVQALEVVNEE
jgi:aromatic ring hydroxylase